MRYKVNTKDCHLIVKAKASIGESIDTTALADFAQLNLAGFMKPKNIKRNAVEYSGPIGISLYERLKQPISKRDFLFIMEQIVVAVQFIQRNSLMLDRVILDIHNVYFNDVTKEIRFLYVPSSKATKNPGIVAFVESIVYSVIPAVEKDMDYISRFIYFLKGQKSFKPELVEKYISKEDIGIMNTIKKQKHYYKHDNVQGNAVLTDPLNDDEPTGLLEESDEATGILDENDEPTALLDQDDDEATALRKENQSISYPTLFRVLTEETISINKPVFRIGREKSYVDYFVTNNNAVSRSHADIITRGNKYFVIDLNSKNHTFINNRMIAVKCETEIRDGDSLKLGNKEEFLFNV